MKNKNDLILQNLVHMIENHEGFFEENLARFMLNTLGKEYLKEAEIDGYNASNWNARTNIYGLLTMKYRDTKLESVPYSYYEKSHNANALTYYQSMLNEVEIKKQKLEHWEKLLNEVSPELIQSAKCTMFVYLKKDRPISMNGWTALCMADKWVSSYLKNPEVWSLSKTEEKWLVNEMIQVSQKFKFDKLTEYNKKDEISYLINLYVKYAEELKKEFLNESIQKKTPEEWVDKLFKSPAIKSLIEQAEINDVSKIFDEESLKILIKKTNLKINVQNYPEMLSNLLPIAEPKKWIEAWSNKINNKLEFNINTFFDNKFIRGYGVSLTKSSYKHKNTYDKQKKSIFEELSYLSPALNSKYISEEALIDFWKSTIKTKDISLLKHVCKNVEFPASTETEKNKEFTHQWKTDTLLSYENKVNKELTLPQIYIMAQEEKLQDTLKEKIEPNIKRVKI